MDPYGHLVQITMGNWEMAPKLNSSTPVQIETSGVVDVSTFWDTTVYVKSDGSLWGMGRNHIKMIKNTGNTIYLSPVKMVENGVAKAAVGSWHLIYLKNDGSVWGRGSNKDGFDSGNRPVLPNKIVIPYKLYPVGQLMWGPVLNIP